jgi:hypothetical protein
MESQRPAAAPAAPCSCRRRLRTHSQRTPPPPRPHHRSIRPKRCWANSASARTWSALATLHARPWGEGRGRVRGGRAQRAGCQVARAALGREVAESEGGVGCGVAGDAPRGRCALLLVFPDPHSPPTRRAPRRGRRRAPPRAAAPPRPPCHLWGHQVNGRDGACGRGREGVSAPQQTRRKARANWLGCCPPPHLPPPPRSVPRHKSAHRCARTPPRCRPPAGTPPRARGRRLAGGAAAVGGGARGGGRAMRWGAFSCHPSCAPPALGPGAAPSARPSITHPSPTLG